MSIKLKTLVIIGISAVILIAILQVFSKLTFENQISGYEDYSLMQTLSRSQGILMNEVDNFGSVASDWANRKDLQKFIQRPTENFVEENLTDEFLLGQRINLAVFANGEKKVVWNKIFNFDHKKIFKDEEMIELIINSDFLTAYKNNNNPSGFINIKGRTMMIVSRPLINNNSVNGYLILGRYLTNHEISRIKNLLKLKVTYHNQNDQLILSEISYQHFGAKNILTKPINDQIIAGYIIFKDIYGSPAFVLRVESERGIFERGRVFINYFMFALAVVVALITLLLISLMIKYVSGRIQNLSSSVLKIGDAKDVSLRVEEEGADEIQYLASEINKMLHQLELSFAKRKEYEKKLIEARDKAEASDKLKSEFLAQMSHEIRTPLNAIISHVSLFEMEIDENMSPETVKSINLISRGGKRLIRTMDLLMNASMLQSGAYEVTKEELFLYGEIILPVCEEYQLNAQDKGLTFSCKKNYENDLKLMADNYSLNQIISNLLDNAIKYTEKGSIICEAGKNKDGKIYIEITDTGIGMSKEYQKKMFDAFSQEDEGYTRQYEGNGLGLTLVKKYCELNDIEIKVTSEKNLGTKFVLVFS